MFVPWATSTTWSTCILVQVPDAKTNGSFLRQLQQTTPHSSLAQSQVRGMALMNHLRRDSWRASHNVHFSPHLITPVDQWGKTAQHPSPPPGMPNRSRSHYQQKDQPFDKGDPFISDCSSSSLVTCLQKDFLGFFHFTVRMIEIEHYFKFSY